MVRVSVEGMIDLTVKLQDISFIPRCLRLSMNHRVKGTAIQVYPTIMLMWSTDLIHLLLKLDLQDYRNILHYTTRLDRLIVEY